MNVLVNPDPARVKAFEDAQKAVLDAVNALDAAKADPDADPDEIAAMNDTVVELTRLQVEAYEAVGRGPAEPNDPTDVVWVVWLKSGKTPTLSDFRILRAANAPADPTRPIPVPVTKERAIRIAGEPMSSGRSVWFLDGDEIVPRHAVAKRFA